MKGMNVVGSGYNFQYSKWYKYPSFQHDQFCKNPLTGLTI